MELKTRGHVYQKSLKTPITRTRQLSMNDKPSRVLVKLTLFRIYYGFSILISFTACGEASNTPRPTLDVPLEYASKHMPSGWWNDAKILSEGRLLYQGAKKSYVNCAKCHGRDGKPIKRGAPDFSNPRRIKRYSDSYWYWRIEEGVPMTSMKAWSKKLSEPEIWKIVAYAKNFGLKGHIYDSESDSWVVPAPNSDGDKAGK